MTNKELNPKGLTTGEAQKLQEEYGKNELTQQKKENFLI